ncbi:MAG TPA: hypothetical protein VFQ44_22710 [Streptosporangiaceae bacterium]|nr:hypothetical protein [Streptosporangiaceae bacterium]
MSFSQNLVLWLHLVFVVFTIGPVTLAIMSTPRYIRQRDPRIVRYLNRITFIFALASLGAGIAGEALASMTSVAGKPWVIVSATLFVVALLLLALILRDQRKAIKALDEAAAAETVARVPELTAGRVPGTAGDEAPQEPASPASPASPDPAHNVPDQAQALHLAGVERGRIAMMGGLVALIWIVILVLMVWH